MIFPTRGIISFNCFIPFESGERCGGQGLAALCRQKAEGDALCHLTALRLWLRLNTGYLLRLVVKHRGRCFPSQDFQAIPRVLNASAWYGLLTATPLSACCCNPRA